MSRFSVPSIEEVDQEVSRMLGPHTEQEDTEWRQLIKGPRRNRVYEAFGVEVPPYPKFRARAKKRVANHDAAPIAKKARAIDYWLDDVVSDEDASPAAGVPEGGAMGAGGSGEADEDAYVDIMNDALPDPVGAREEVVLTRQEDALPFASDAADVAEGAIAREAGASASVPLIGAGTSFSPFVVRGFSDDEDLEDGCFVDPFPGGEIPSVEGCLGENQAEAVAGKSVADGAVGVLPEDIRESPCNILPFGLCRHLPYCLF
jgi:hypothetical protein